MQMRIGLLGRLLLADEVADRHAVELRDLREDIHVGQTLAALPFGHGFVGIIELPGQIQLGVLVRLAIGGDVFGDGAPQRLFVLDHGALLSEKY